MGSDLLLHFRRMGRDKPLRPYHLASGHKTEGYGMDYTSRPGRPRDGKYQHPRTHSRQLNGAFPGYYEMALHDYSRQAYYNGYPSSRPQQNSSSKRGYYKKEGRNSKEGKKKGEKKDKNIDEDKLYNDEFPPLNGNSDQQHAKGSKQVNGKGVWDSPPLWKGKEELKTGHSSIKSRGGLHIYRSLVPKPPLNGNSDQQDAKGNKQVNGKGVSDNPPLGKGTEDLKTGHSSIKSHGGLHIYRSHVYSKSTHGPRNPPMDILKTQFVMTPKTLGDKQSQFFKILQKENANKVEDGEKTPTEKQEPAEKQENIPENKPGENQLVNGIDNLEIEEANDSRVLFSSLEAELRRLRDEMSRYMK